MNVWAVIGFVIIGAVCGAAIAAFIVGSIASERLQRAKAEVHALRRENEAMWNAEPAEPVHCKGTTKTGTHCRATIVDADGYCGAHQTQK